MAGCHRGAPRPRTKALEWALSGFQSPAVWLAFSAFMLGLGYERTALATTTAHATAVLPVMLAVGLGIPGLPAPAFAVVLAMSHGLMGVISPYAPGPAPVYHGSGYLPSGTFWRLGSAFGAVFLGVLLLLGLPAALATWR